MDTGRQDGRAEENDWIMPQCFVSIENWKIACLLVCGLETGSSLLSSWSLGRPVGFMMHRVRKRRRTHLEHITRLQNSCNASEPFFCGAIEFETYNPALPRMRILAGTLPSRDLLLSDESEPERQEVCSVQSKITVCTQAGRPIGTLVRGRSCPAARFSKGPSMARRAYTILQNPPRRYAILDRSRMYCCNWSHSSSLSSSFKAELGSARGPRNHFSLSRISRNIPEACRNASSASLRDYVNILPRIGRLRLAPFLADSGNICFSI